jgi:E3 ubiquitin-protein ligase listerin
MQAWMGSDEDLDEMVASEVTLVLFNLVPILQNVQGAHWDFIMDLIESNLEVSALYRVYLLFRRLTKTLGLIIQ